jgi:hypothetical protein
MANTLLSPTIIAKEALFQLSNNLVMGRNVVRTYKNEFVKIGDTVTIRKPVKFRTKDGATLDSVNVVERSLTQQIDKRKHVAWPFTSQELTLNIDMFSERYVKPAMIALSNIMDEDGCAKYKDIYNLVGTPGTTPSTLRVLSDARTRLNKEAVPMEMRHCVLDPDAEGAFLTGDLKGLFSQQIISDVIERGKLGGYLGFDFDMDQNIQTHTTGAFTSGATPLMNGATAEGATSIVTDGWDAGNNTVKQGDVFTIANVYAVNPVSGVSTGELRQFVATADATSAGGAMTISVSPAIYSSAAGEDNLPYQTVDAVPANDAALTFVGTESTNYNQNMAFHTNAFSLVTVPLVVPDSVSWGAMEADPQTGLAIRVLKDYDVTNDQEYIRFDIMYGWKTIYPELACRITG